MTKKLTNKMAFVTLLLAETRKKKSCQKAKMIPRRWSLNMMKNMMRKRREKKIHN